MTDQNPEDYLTREEAAVYAGVALITIDRRLRDGTLPKYTNGLVRARKCVRIAKSDLDRMLKPRRK